MAHETELTFRNKHGIELEDLSPSPLSADMYVDDSFREQLANVDSREGASLLLDPGSEGEQFETGGDYPVQPHWMENIDSRKKILFLPLLFILKIWEGPVLPKDNPPRPIRYFPKLEVFPFRLKEIVPKKLQIVALIVYLSLWSLICFNILIPYLTVPPSDPEDPNSVVIPISCLSQGTFWNGKNGECGFNGELCPSFQDKEVVFRCPALCDRGSFTFSFLPVGDQLIKYRGYYVGGGSLEKLQMAKDLDDPEGRYFISRPYRSDSFPCGAAIHSGTISPFFGGCTRIKYVGDQPLFPSTIGHYGVDVSIPFLSFFQSSYAFKELKNNYLQCYDPRLLILVINIILGLPIVYLASGLVTFWTITTVGFWTIALATDPPRTVDASNMENFADLISLCLGRFLPTCFILYVLWHCSVSKTLTIPIREAEGQNIRRPSVLYKIFLFYPFFWLGILNNVTFDRLPVDRLTILDLQTQPGSLIAVGSIISLIFTCAFIQAYKIWLSGRFRKYLMIYALFVVGLVLVASLPGLTLRIHHYILAMLLIPGCATRGKTALMFQGILLGLFLSGASRWGLAAIAETAGSLRRDDPQGIIFPPAFEGFDPSSGMLKWQDLNTTLLSPIDESLFSKYNGYSLLVNDIERYVGLTTDKAMNLTDLLHSETLSRLINSSLKDGFKDKNGDIPIYLRIGRKVLGSMKYSDFSKAAVLRWPSGDFELPTEGVT